MKTEYITVDLDLKTNGPCDCTVAEFEKRGEAYSKWGEGHEYTHYITLSLMPHGSADECIRAFLDEYSSYPDNVKREWASMPFKEFLVGYRAGHDNFTFEDHVSSETLKAAASLGFGVGLVIYPPSDDPEHYFGEQ